jgi:hypothetical protein
VVEGSWQPVGDSPLNGMEDGSRYGSAVAISNDGSKIVIRDVGYNEYSERVQAKQLSSNNTWVLRTVATVAINNDANRLIVGAIWYGENSRRVHVYYLANKDARGTNASLKPSNAPPSLGPGTVGANTTFAPSVAPRFEAVERRLT